MRVESGSVKNGKYALKELTPVDGIEPSGLPPVYWNVEDRDHITLGRVSHSEPGWSVRRCVVTGLI